MPLRVRCECGESLTVPENKAGMQVLCPLCNRQVTIPPPRPAASPVAKPASGDGGAKRPQPRAPQPRQAPSPPPAPPLPPPRKPRKTKEVASAKPASRNQPARTTPTPPPLPNAKTKTHGSKPAVIEKSVVETSHPIEPPPIAASKPVAAAKPSAAELRKEPPPTASPAKKSAEEDKRPQSEPLRGVEHDPGKKWTVYQLGMAVAVLGLTGMYPSIAEVVRHVTDFDSTGVETWAYLLFLLTGIQLVYALYMVQLPDWSTMWVVMILCACVTVFYAMGTGVSLMARQDNALVGALGLSAQQAKGYLSMWCLMMTMLHSLLTYFLVRASVKWQKSFDLAMAGR